MGGIHGMGVKSMALEVEVANEQNRLPIDEVRLTATTRQVLSGEGISSGTISIAIVDDLAMHALNRRFLDHDYPTDVLSFVLERKVSSADGPGGPSYELQGEVIVSADTALATAARYEWSPTDELLLYVIHGCLHLAGYDDQTEEARAAMRQRERFYLAELGIGARHDEPSNQKSEI